METYTVTPSEWALLEILWRDGPQTLTELVPKLSESAGWSKSTTATMLRRMSEKGILGYEVQGRGKLFFPNIQREEVVDRERDSLLRRAYNGSIGMLVSAMAENNRLTKQDIAELYAILKDAEENAK